MPVTKLSPKDAGLEFINSYRVKLIAEQCRINVFDPGPFVAQEPGVLLSWRLIVKQKDRGV